MAKALVLAQKGRGRVEPNPMVGCVIVREGRLVAGGYHRKFGGPHAEIDALKKAGKQAAGATAYVTLEPCCHVGKTPPCTTALIKAGVKRVIAAHRDPFPKVAGGGFSALRNAGIETLHGLMQFEAEQLNAPYLCLLLRRRPFVIAKWAQSLDGKIATGAGDSKWITGPDARKRVHELRGYVDGVIVGARTVEMDDPQLTARDVRPRRIAQRIVFDSQLRISEKSIVVRFAKDVPTIVMTTIEAGRRRLSKTSRLQKLGVRVVACRSKQGRVSPADALRRLGAMGMTNVLLEGGGQLIGSFADAGLIDEAHVFTAPLIIGGDGVSACCGKGISLMRNAVRGRVLAHANIEGDQFVVVRFWNPKS
ncbi:MAG: bifunctional diaminohydroxyphosphoribosylaminopyrimidine deaminase/5-amino-6-(5-phosphoribosylamino)uracil reductase RibD [Planctomycetes bacterium]|nr:bifunctional diaminohydroxyphosphoribosylaminopyrimidine deaminase/5-amino-6-(5-phosphoribosylamino)uracil reductase RibD [Planctomycetota bacterium]